jgi:hypothetical protein
LSDFEVDLIVDKIKNKLLLAVRAGEKEGKEGAGTGKHELDQPYRTAYILNCYEQLLALSLI